MPKCSRRASYQRPAKRYSASASSSKRTRGFTAGEVRLQRGGARRPRPLHQTRPRGPGGLAVQFRRPKRLRHQLGAAPPRRQGWPTVRPQRPHVHRGVAPRLRAEHLALVTSYSHSTGTGSPTPVSPPISSGLDVTGRSTRAWTPPFASGKGSESTSAEGAGRCSAAWGRRSRRTWVIPRAPASRA